MPRTSRRKFLTTSSAAAAAPLFGAARTWPRYAHPMQFDLRIPVDGSFNLTFTNEGKRLRVWVAAEGSTEVIVAEGLTNSPDRKMTMLILRRKAAQTRFAAVFEPVSPEETVRAVRIEKAGVVIESTRGVRVEP